MLSAGFELESPASMAPLEHLDGRNFRKAMSDNRDGKIVPLCSARSAAEARRRTAALVESKLGKCGRAGLGLVEMGTPGAAANPDRV